MAFEKLKFKAKDVKHCVQIQEALFDKGYRWRSNGDLITNDDAAYLYTDVDGFIQYGCDPDTYKHSKDYTEADIELSYKINVKRFVEYNGKSYDARLFEEAIAKLTPVEE